MTTTQKLTHIKARLREIVRYYKNIHCDVHDPLKVLMAENWIEMIEGLESDMRSQIEVIQALSQIRSEKTISRWESVYGVITEEKTR